jgi:PBSX family phage terminase large subunit
MKLQSLSPKQRDFLINSTARINIAYGSVRSGKTIVSLLRWLYIVATAPEGSGLLLCAKTERTLRRNILNLIQELIEPENFHLNSGMGECTIYGKRVYLVGANDERSENKIRGITLYAAYCDELTLFPESFVQMLLSRLSEPNALLLATTNPDSPYHFVKTKFIDRENALDLKCWKFLLEDNNTLLPDYITALKAEYMPGTVWYRRYILGDFALAEGLVYNMFDISKHVIKDLPTNWSNLVVGVDFGAASVTTYIMLGRAAAGPHIGKWIAWKEYYHDATKQAAKTTFEFSKDMKTFLDRGGSLWNVSSIEVDPSASPLKVQFRRDGLVGMKDADNSVQAGIMDVASALSSGKLLIHESCKHLIGEMQTYSWDIKAAAIGEDKPIKKDDHVLDATRYAIRRIFKRAY